MLLKWVQIYGHFVLLRMFQRTPTKIYKTAGCNQKEQEWGAGGGVEGRSQLLLQA
jgi:hypothetical protein